MEEHETIYLPYSIMIEKSLMVPIETVICVFVMKYCKSRMPVVFVDKKAKYERRLYPLDSRELHNFSLSSKRELPKSVYSCEMPNVFVSIDTMIAGLCASLRQIVKNKISSDEDHEWISGLLGFKDSCLLAPSETSVWTKYCEVDVVKMLATYYGNAMDKVELPETLARFETHMGEPVRLHNVYKYTMSKKFSLDGTTTNERGVIPDHIYAEGSFVTLADLIIFVCFHLFFMYFRLSEIEELLPLTSEWYARMKMDNRLSQCLKIVTLENVDFSRVSHVLPIVKRQSLYKSDPKRYKPRNRAFTKQEDIEKSLSMVDVPVIKKKLNEEPYGADIIVDWSKIPYDAKPEGGDLPIARLKRKYEQLENLCRPVLKLAKRNDVIVDFCSGGGHLGILVAHLLPHCVVVLLENKEESLNRSKARVQKLQLTNVKFFQCNLDYFTGYFDIGMSLHACGVATDLVIRHCIQRRAIFVSCPCCYGSVQDCHHISYPRSQTFHDIINQRNYFVLGHAADQTHDAENAKTAQGNECMAIIDTDRKLHAEENGYEVHLAKLVPETCTPKNHLIVGIPKYRL